MGSQALQHLPPLQPPTSLRRKTSGSRGAGTGASGIPERPGRAGGGGGQRAVTHPAAAGSGCSARGNPRPQRRFRPDAGRARAASSHLLLQLLLVLHVGGPPQEPQPLQVPPVHAAGQEEVEGEGDGLRVPLARVLHVIPRVHPEGVDLRRRRSRAQAAASAAFRRGRRRDPSSARPSPPCPPKPEPTGLALGRRSVLAKAISPVSPQTRAPRHHSGQRIGPQRGHLPHVPPHPSPLASLQGEGPSSARPSAPRPPTPEPTSITEEQIRPHQGHLPRVPPHPSPPTSLQGEGPSSSRPSPLCPSTPKPTGIALGSRSILGEAISPMSLHT